MGIPTIQLAINLPHAHVYDEQFPIDLTKDAQETAITLGCIGGLADGALLMASAKSVRIYLVDPNLLTIGQVSEMRERLQSWVTQRNECPARQTHYSYDPIFLRITVTVLKKD